MKTIGETLFEDQISLNIFQIRQPIQRMNLETDLKKPSIAASFGGGRTANQLCEFASGYALWRQFGILNYIDAIQYDKLTKTFDLPAVNENDNSSAYYIWNEGK